MLPAQRRRQVRGAFGHDPVFTGGKDLFQQIGTTWLRVGQNTLRSRLARIVDLFQMLRHGELRQPRQRGKADGPMGGGMDDQT